MLISSGCLELATENCCQLLSYCIVFSLYCILPPSWRIKFIISYCIVIIIIIIIIIITIVSYHKIV